MLILMYHLTFNTDDLYFLGADEISSNNFRPVVEISMVHGICNMHILI